MSTRRLAPRTMRILGWSTVVDGLALLLAGIIDHLARAGVVPRSVPAIGVVLLLIGVHLLQRSEE